MNLRRLSVLAATAFCAFAISGETLAQTSLDEPLDERSSKRLDRLEKAVKELRAIVFQGRETGQPVVVQPAETQTQINSLGDRLNDLDHTLTRLNGAMDVVRHDLDQYRQEANDLRAQNAALKEQITALDQRIQGLTAPPPPPSSETAAPGSTPAPDAAGAFAAARAKYLAGDTAGAESAFHAFVDQYGDGPRGPEARYYLAKTLLERKAWPEAATADIGAIRGWPQTRWAPDAVLDLSRALIGLGKASDACQTLDELSKRYPLASKGVKVGAQDVRAQAKCG